MGTITSSGVGSGIDIEGLVTRLVQSERAPRQTQLATQQAGVQAKLTAYGQVRSALAQLQTAARALADSTVFRGRSATVGDADVLAATAGATAAPGSYAVEVVRLARGAKLASGAFAAASTTVGTGTLTIASGATSFTVAVDGANGTLAGIRDAINAARGNSGVAATIVTANDGARLVLTGTKTGVANAITVTASGGDGGLAALAYDPANGVTGLTELQAAQDARVVVDGFAFDSPTNAVTGALDGVTLNLKEASAPGTPTTVTVAVDTARAQGAITGFVTAYNQVVTGLRSLGAYDAARQQGGPLVGDSLLRAVLGGVRAQVGGASDGLAGNAFRALADVGITTNLDGTLKADAAKLGAAFAADPAAVQRLFADDAGVAKRLDGLLDSYLRAGGLIAARADGLQGTLKDIAGRQEALATRMDAYERRLRAQFTAMDTLVAQLRQTGQNLVAQLATIPTGTTDRGG